MPSRILVHAPALALTLVVACGGDQYPTAPGEPDMAKGGNGSATPLTASPSSLALLMPSSTSGTVTATVQFTGLITASSSDEGCATASPLSLPATKPRGSSAYVATFTVTAVGSGDCTVTLTDKRGGTATVEVAVRELPPVDGSRLAFSQADATFDANVYTMNPDGSGRVQVTTDDGGQGSPVFLPDRSKIVYVSDEAGSLNLFMANPDGSGQEQLTFYDIGTHAGAGTLSPAVSPDGQKIVFVLSTGFLAEPTHLHVMDAVAGATPVPITAGNDLNHDPTYTPDGRIVFASASIEAAQETGLLSRSIFSVNADGTNLVQLTNAAESFESHFAPDVSPDGTTIAFTRFSWNTSESLIDLVDIDGGNQRSLTTVGHDSQAQFSPAGTWIVFTRAAESSGDLMALKLGRPEAEAVHITTTDVVEYVTDWR